MWEMFPNIWFNETTTQELLISLDAYHRKEEKTSASITSVIVHDWSSHDADAFGYIAEAELAGLITKNLPRLAAGRHNVTVSRGVRIANDPFDSPETRKFSKIRVRGLTK